MSRVETLTASDGHHLSAYIAGDADSERAIVVIQEAFGVHPLNTFRLRPADGDGLSRHCSRAL